MNQQTAEPIVVLMTAANAEEAERIAQALVEGRLAACVQILPAIKSVYRWQGEIASESEVLLLAKTISEKFDELDRVVQANHSYETPEIIALPVNLASEPYLKWLIDSVDSSVVK